MTREARKLGLETLARSILSKKDSDALVVIYPHVRADGDAYGSSFALVGALAKLGIEVITLCEERVNPFLMMPFTESARVWPDLKDDEKKAIQERQSLAIQVDASEDTRFASRQEVYYSSPEQAIIDHHINIKPNEDLVFIDPDAGANTELVYTLILVLEELSGIKLFDHDVAIALYIGLLTDTGGFTYDNVSPETLRIGAELLEYGIEVAQLNNRLFKEKPWRVFQIEGQLALDSKLSEGGEISYLTVSRAYASKYGVLDSDLNAVPALLRDIQGVKVSLFMRESAEGYRGNLRSTGDFDVAYIASLYDGGGHKNAAGFTVENTDRPIEEVCLEVVSKVKSRLELR